MSQPQNITYRELVAFYGPRTARALLRTIEAALGEKSNVIYLDNELRLQHALASMNRELRAA